jgi:LDH2 family malate/lactate/ureidoglycolate dehydrogenase
MLGQDFAPGIGVDANGEPTTSPQAIANGGLLPFGGHKGYGLSLIVQGLGVLAGAREARGDVIDSGFLFIAIDPGLLMPREAFQAQIAEMMKRIKSLPRKPGVDDIRMPSQRAYAERVRRRSAGVPVARAVHERLLMMAGGRQ